MKKDQECLIHTKTLKVKVSVYIQALLPWWNQSWHGEETYLSKSFFSIFLWHFSYINYIWTYIISFSIQFVDLLLFRLCRWNLINSEIKMKELGRSIQYNARKMTSLIRTLKCVQDKITEGRSFYSERA